MIKRTNHFCVLFIALFVSLLLFSALARETLYIEPAVRVGFNFGH